MKVVGKDALYHKLVFEVRYEHGLVYLDRCGTTLNRITTTHPEWILREDAISAQAAPLIHATTGIQFTVGPYKYDFSLDQPINREIPLTHDDIQAFIAQVDLVSKIVHEELELSQFIREGFRVWYLFGTESEADSQRWIASLGAFEGTSRIGQGFQGKIESEGYVAVMDVGDRKLRFAVNAVERLEHLDLGTEALKTLPRSLPKGQREALLNALKAKRRLLSNPAFAVMIDIDAYVDRPIEVVPADFISQSLSMIDERLPRACSGGNR
jgi:hypothetical protein